MPYVKRPLLTPIFAILVLALIGALASAQTMNGGLELSQVYRPDMWQPVQLELRNESDRAIEGSAVLPLADAKAPAQMRLPVSVPAHSRVRVTLWGYFQRTAQIGKQKQRDQAPPLTIAEWRGTDGALLARSPVLGFPLSAKSTEQGAAENGEMVLLVNQRSEVPDDQHDLEALLNRLTDSTHITFALVAIGPEALTRQPSGLRPVKAVVFEDVDPESLDAAQREALLCYLRGGGVVVLPAPAISVGRPGNWLAPFFPVRTIGTRLANQIEVRPGGPALTFTRPTIIVEAVAGEGQTLLRGPDYVHVAVRPVGLGKVVFTSFAVNALAETQPQVNTLWEELLDLRRPQWEWDRSQLGEARAGILSGMIGRKVAPWSVAAAVAGGYVLLVILVQSLFVGSNRPRAFAFSLGGALLLSATLGLMGMARHNDAALQSARLSIIDISSGGGGWQQESLALVGADDPNLALQAADDGVMIRPALADSSNRPTLRQQPFAVEKADVRSERIERVWEAAGPADPQWHVRATAHFTPRGLTLDVDNALGRAIAAPLVVWNHRAWAASDLPVGRSSVPALKLNERDDFSAGTLLASEQSKRQAAMIRASLAVPDQSSDADASDSPPPPPMLIGWLNDPPPALICAPDRPTMQPKAMCMVRTPLKIEPVAPGTLIPVPAALVSTNPGKLPYDLAKGHSVPSQQEGQWLVRFSVPHELGQVRPTRATLEVRLSVPAHELLIRKGQCSGGQSKADESGAVVAQWKSTVGSQKVSFDCTPAQDCDRDGAVWLLLDIRSATPGVPAAAPWQIRDLALAIDAQAVAPPAPFSFEQ
jgi:hypothetical protein